MNRKRTALLILCLCLLTGVTRAQAPMVFPQLGQQLGQGGSLAALSAVVAFSPDSSRIASSSDGNSIKLWQVESGRELQTLTGHTSPVSSLAFLPSGDQLCSGCEDGSLRLWDLRTGRTLRVFTVHQEKVFAIALSPDGKLLASASSKSARLWELRTGMLLRTFTGDLSSVIPGYTPPFISMAFSPDGGQVIVSSMDSTIRAWSTARGRLALKIDRESVPIPVGADILGFTPEGQLIVSRYGGLFVIDLDKRKAFTLDTPGKPIALSRDHKLILSQPGSDMRFLTVLDGETRKLQVSLTLPEGVMHIALAPDARRIAAIGFFNSLSIFDAGTGKLLQDFSSQVRIPSSGTFSRDGNWITLVGSQPKDPSKPLSNFVSIARRWNLKAARQELEFDFIGANNRVMELRKAAQNEQDREQVRKLSEELSFHRYEEPSWNPEAGQLYRIESPYGGNTLTFWRIPVDPSNPSANDKKNAAWVPLKVFQPHAKPITAQVLSYPFKLVATGSEDRTIKLFEFPSGRLLKTLTGHRGSVQGLTFSPDGTRLLSCSLDGTARLWDIAKGTELAQFISFSDGEWITITPEGYFNASPGGERHLNVRLAAATYGIENYREAFYRPDLVKLALEGGDLSSFRSLAEVKQPPRVAIVQTPASTESPDCTLTLSLEDQGGGLGDVRVFLNGSAILLDSARGVQVLEVSGKATLRQYPLKLSEGRNSLRAVAFNAENSMQSDGATWEIIATFKARQKPSMHALVVGIQEFRNPKLQLKYAVADANLMADALEKGSAGLFEIARVTRLTSREATTKEALQSALKGYRGLNPDDLFILYVASHGTVDEGEYFLIPSNVGALSTQRLRSDALSQSELKELVANIPSTKKLIIIDTCNAGQLGQALQSALLTRGMSEDTAIKVLSRAVGSTILSASTSMQEALEGYQGHGLFTWALVEGLVGKADKGHTGFVKTTDLATYVEDQVPELAERLFKHAQFPTISISGQGFPVGKTR